MKFVTDPCPEDKAFRFKDGNRARSLDEFNRIVQHAPADVLQYHKTHFHYWLKDIVQDPQLAERVKHEGERARDGEQLRGSLTTILGQVIPTKAGQKH